MDRKKSKGMIGYQQFPMWLASEQSLVITNNQHLQRNSIRQARDCSFPNQDLFVRVLDARQVSVHPPPRLLVLNIRRTAYFVLVFHGSSRFLNPISSPFYRFQFLFLHIIR